MKTEITDIRRITDSANARYFGKVNGKFFCCIKLISRGFSRSGRYTRSLADNSSAWVVREKELTRGEKIAAKRACMKLEYPK